MPTNRGPDRWLFDGWSLFYDAPLVQRLTYRPGQDAVLAALAEPSLVRILDVGCGTGILARRVARELRDRRVTACDFSRGMLRRAAAREAAVGCVQADAQRLPFPAGCFDAVISTEAFHWFPDQPRALAEFRRVLVHGGRLLVVASAARTEWLSRITRAGSRLLGEPLRWPTRQGMRAMLATAGFRVVRQHPVLRLPAPIAMPAVLNEAVAEPRPSAEAPSGS